GIFLLQRITDGIVLCGKESVQKAESHPPVVDKTGKIQTIFRIKKKQSIFLQFDLAVCSCSEPKCLIRAAPIDLRGIPPVTVLVQEGRWLTGCRVIGWISRSGWDSHGFLWPVIARLQCDLKPFWRCCVSSM